MSHSPRYKNHGCSSKNVPFVLEPEFDFATEVVWIFVVASEEADYLVLIKTDNNPLLT